MLPLSSQSTNSKFTDAFLLKPPHQNTTQQLKLHWNVLLRWTFWGISYLFKATNGVNLIFSAVCLGVVWGLAGGWQWAGAEERGGQQSSRMMNNWHSVKLIFINVASINVWCLLYHYTSLTAAARPQHTTEPVPAPAASSSSFLTQRLNMTGHSVWTQDMGQQRR